MRNGIYNAMLIITNLDKLIGDVFIKLLGLDALAKYCVFEFFIDLHAGSQLRR